LEIGHFSKVNLVFVFSERPNFIYQNLSKYNLEDKLKYISDPSMKIFDTFKIKKIYNKITESEQRNSHIFVLKSNQILNYLEYGRELP